MPDKLKISTIVGTRPEIIRLSRVIPKLDKYFNHTLIHTGQNFDYELNQVFFKDLNIREPDIFLECGGKNAAKTIASVIDKTDDFLSKNHQDAVLILGDTNSSLASISAKRRKIPIFHMEAGNRSFDQRVPEEINRKIVDHISDINLPYTSIAREYLINEGIKPELIIKTGSPLYEVINFYKDKINQSKILHKLKLKKGNFFLVSSHREENIDSDNFQRLFEALNMISKKFSLPILFSVHPRTMKKIEKEKIKLNKLINLHKPLNFSDYCKLQLSSKVVLSDSGSITEESSILNFPALNIREAHERPEGFEEATVMMTGLDIDKILNAIKILEDEREENKSIKIIQDYIAPNLSDKIVKIILSHINYVNTFIWKK
tara:strand:+ start:833 stop:1957 length:1125 start_codon:yes stop_codon:yes gene_type:complete